MRSPPPMSASQRAYMFQRDKFLARIMERALRLAEDGYTVERGEHCHEFLVTPPACSIPYVVNALEQTCTCCFFRRQMEGEPLTRDGTLVACKHLHGLKALIRAEYVQLAAQQRWCCYYRLRIGWLQTLAAQWQEHQARQCQQEASADASTLNGSLCRRCAAQETVCNVNVKTKGNHTS